MMYSKAHVNIAKKAGKYLVTTDYGSWDLMDEGEYKLFNSGNLDENPSLKKRLEEKAIIITKNNVNKPVEMMKDRYGYMFNGASLHVVVPTLRCNHVCVYCHSKSKKEDEKGYDMDEDTAKKTVDFIFQTPAEKVIIEFQGGEPLLNFDIVQKIIEYGTKVGKEKKKKYRFDLVTNLTKMDDDILKYLIKNKVGLCTSLDGPKEVHNKNRAYSGGSSYDSVVEWIRKIKEDHKYSVDALMVTTKHSLPYHKEIIDEYVKNKLKFVKIRHIDKLGFAEKAWKEIGYTPEEYLDFWKKSMAYLVEVNKKTPIKDRMVEYMLAKLNGIWVNYVDLQNPCGAVIGQIAYSQNGDIYTCDEGRQHDIFKLGNVKKDTYKGILTSEKTCSMIAASTTDTLLCDACVYKPYCGVCPVCCYAETGNLVPKANSTDSRCKIYKGMYDYMIESLAGKTVNSELFKKWINDKDILNP